MAVSLRELDLLLTGGRLENKGAVQAAYRRDGWKDRVRHAMAMACHGSEWQDAQKALVLTPEFNTMGNPMSGAFSPPAE